MFLVINMISYLRDGTLILYHHKFSSAKPKKQLTREEVACMLNFAHTSDESDNICSLCRSEDTNQYDIKQGVSVILCADCDFELQSFDRSLVYKMKCYDVTMSHESLEAVCVFRVGRAITGAEVSAIVAAILCWRNVGVIDDIIWHIILCSATLYMRSHRLDRNQRKPAIQ